MTKLKLHQGEWVVICDGAKALVLENVGDEKFPNLRAARVFRDENPSTHEQGTDRPGRGFARAEATCLGPIHRWELAADQRKSTPRNLESGLV